MKSLSLTLCMMVFLPFGAIATVYTVNSLGNGNTGAANSGTLRYCITQANLSVGPHTINFSVAGTISIAADANALPALARAITIDGSTAPGFLNTPVVTINGTGCTSINGLQISAANCNIYALDITAFPYRGVNFTSDAADNCIFGASGKGNMVRNNLYYGMQLNGADNCIISYNMIGVNATGAACSANSYDGVDLNGNANSNQILFNHISCNGYNGLQIGNSDFNIVKGNIFGPLSGSCTNNGYRGIDIELGSNGNVIGGTAPGEGNKITGNLYWGIEVKDAGSINNIISGNNICCNDYGGIEINTGGNNNIVNPVITLANASTVSGTSLANAVIEIFRSQDPAYIVCPMAPTPNNQGLDYLGTTTANGAGAWTLAGSFSGTLVATQRDASGNTSEFSAGVVTGTAPVFITNCPGSIVLGDIADYFSVECNQGSAEIIWKLSGTEGAQVRVERSHQNGNFETIATFNDLEDGPMHFLDHEISGGILAYRLALIDQNGGQHHSEIKNLLSEGCQMGENFIRLFPNPVSASLNIWFPPEFSGDGILEIADATRRGIQQIEINFSDGSLQTFDLSSFPNGMYFVKVISAGKSEVKRFSIQR